MNKSTFHKMIAGAGLALLLAAPGAVRPAQAQAAQFGSVDVQKILAGYGKKDDYQKRIDALSRSLDSRFRAQANSPMLSKEEQQTLGGLLGKAGASDAERAQITALQQKSKKDADALAALQQKASPTDADKNTLDALTKEQAAGQQALAEIADDYKNQVQKLNDQINKELTDTVRNAISDIAKQKGLAVVFDAQVAIYTANDITDDVVKKLNK